MCSFRKSNSFVFFFYFHPPHITHSACYIISTLMFVSLSRFFVLFDLHVKCNVCECFVCATEFVCSCQRRMSLTVGVFFVKACVKFVMSSFSSRNFERCARSFEVLWCLFCEEKGDFSRTSHRIGIVCFVSMSCVLCLSFYVTVVCALFVFGYIFKTTKLQYLWYQGSSSICHLLLWFLNILKIHIFCVGMHAPQRRWLCTKLKLRAYGKSIWDQKKILWVCKVNPLSKGCFDWFSDVYMFLVEMQLSGTESECLW